MYDIYNVSNYDISAGRHAIKEHRVMCIGTLLCLRLKKQRPLCHRYDKLWHISVVFVVTFGFSYSYY